MQTRLQSLVESTAGTLIGFGVSTLANYLILPLFGYNATALDSIGMGLIFTVISFIRSYFVRRLFNYIHRIK